MIDDALTSVTDTAQKCRNEGIPIDIISCGGTGTYWISAFQPGITEIQAGGGIFCDVIYRNQFGVEHPYALTVLATVTSRPAPTRIICDAGRKTMSEGAADPAPIGISGVESVGLSAEPWEGRTPPNRAKHRVSETKLSSLSATQMSL